MPDATPSAEALASVVVLGLLCTAAAFVLFGGLLLEVGPGRAAVITYVAPVVAVGLGVAVLGERPGVGAAAGLLLILAGSWLSTDGRLPPGMGAWVARVRARRRGGAAPRTSRPASPRAHRGCVGARPHARPRPRGRGVEAGGLVHGRQRRRGGGSPPRRSARIAASFARDRLRARADPPAGEANDPQVGRLQVGVELVVVLEGGRGAVGRERIDLDPEAGLGPVEVQLLVRHHDVRLRLR